MRAPVVRSPLEAEIAAARNRGNLRAFDYVTRDHGGNITTVRCKICGNVIANKVGRGLRHTAVYEEITFLCSDGSRHVSAVCTCARRANRQTLRDAFIADLADFYHNEGSAGETIANKYFLRQPEAVVREPDGTGPRTRLPIRVPIANRGS